MSSTQETKYMPWKLEKNIEELTFMRGRDQTIQSLIKSIYIVVTNLFKI